MDRTGLEWAYEAGSTGMAYQTRVLQVAYLVLALWFVVWAIRTARQAVVLRQAGPRREVLWLAALVGLGLLLRLMAPSSPMDIHHRLAPAFYAWQTPAHYGWSLPVLAVGVWQIAGRSHELIFTIDALIGAATLVPLHALARRLGLGEWGRFWAVLAMATMPLHVRYSHTDNQSILEVALLLVALCALSSWAERPRYGPALLTGIALGVAMGARPEACVLALVGLGWVLLVERPRRAPVGQLVLGIGAIVAVAGVHALAMIHLLLSTPLGAVIREQPALHGWSPLDLVFFQPRWVTPTIWVGLAASVLAPRPKLRIRLALWVLATGLGLLVWNASALDLGLIGARHQLRALPFVALLAGAGLGHVTERLPHWGRALANRFARRRGVRPGRAAPLAQTLGALVLAAALLLGLPSSLRPTTMNLEWSFFSRVLGQLPSCCTFAVWYPPDDRSLRTPAYLSQALGARHRWVPIEELDSLRIAPDECLLYYRPASCYAHDRDKPIPRSEGGRPAMVEACRSWEAKRSLRPFWTVSLPPRSSGTDYFGRGPLEVGFFRVDHAHPDPRLGRCWKPPAAGIGQALSERERASRSERSAWVPAWPAAAAPSEPTAPSPPSSPEPWNACPLVFTPSHADELYPQLLKLPVGSCHFVSLDVVKDRCHVRWRGPRGAEVTATILPSACVGWLDRTAVEAGEVSLLESTAAASGCTEAYEALQQLVRSGAVPAPTPAQPR